MPAKRRAATAVEPEPAPCTVETVGLIFQDIHRSAAHTQKCKKEMVTLATEHRQSCIDALCGVVLIILKQVPQLTSDALKRHYGFLAETAKAFREHLDTDEASVAIMRSVMPFHNANDKAVRLAVATTIDVLLKTVDQSNTSEDRQDFYQDLAELLKQRVHDKCPHVREKAISAIAVFQTGKKTCDVTQQLIALLCTDSNADVRKQILKSIAPRKEFLEGYFHGMVRSTRDAVARVRAEAWDALSRFPWRYITAYASAKNIRLCELLSQGLMDSNSSTSIACRAALTNSWLHRDCKDACATLLEPISCGFVIPSLEPLDMICNEMLAYLRKKKSPEHFQLDLQDINVPALLMWKADAKLSSETETEDDTQLLLPLEQFAALLQDTVYAYAKPDAEPKSVKFRSLDDADNMLRVLLSVFDVYEENAYLAHTDNTTRNALLKLINFLLKVVPDDDPSLFVDVAVRSLKSLTVRLPEEGTKAVTSALDSLFRSLKLPQRYGLGFDDVEALGRKSRERQQELVKKKVLLRSGDVTQEQYDDLREEMERDEKFMLRMQLIVLAFLSHSRRGDDIPMFCSHVVRLGRQQDSEKVKVAATKSLGLQCLIRPDMVHTFMPLILADTHEHVLTSTNESVAIAAIGVCFDLIMEYGLKFFDRNAARTEGAANLENAVEARLQHEKELAEEDVHKVGSKHLVAVLLSYLSPSHPAKNAVCVAGFCKLLSCNRLPVESTVEVLSNLLIHYVWSQVMKQSSTTAAYLFEYLSFFFRSYASSHPKRMEDFAQSGVTAFRVLLLRNASWATKLIEFVLRTSDAFSLTQIRDIDPDTYKKIQDKATAETDGDETASASSRSITARSSMQSGRLLRELSRYSTHEHIAEGLVVEMASSDSPQDIATCLDVLEKRMIFYSKEPQPFLHFATQAAATHVKAVRTANASDLLARLEAWMEQLEQRFPTATEDAGNKNGEALPMDQRFEKATASRTAVLQKMIDAGYADIADIPEVTRSHSSSTVGGVVQRGEGVNGTGVKRERDVDTFGVDALVGPSKRRA